MGIGAPRPVGNDGGVKHLPAAGAFPGIKRTDEIIEFLGKHTAFAARTLHGIPPS
jgi:hypothetical protein